MEIIKGGVTAAKGFEAASTAAGIKNKNIKRLFGLEWNVEDMVQHQKKMLEIIKITFMLYIDHFLSLCVKSCFISCVYCFISCNQFTS